MSILRRKMIKYKPLRNKIKYLDISKPINQSETDFLSKISKYVPDVKILKINNQIREESLLTFLSKMESLRTLEIESCEVHTENGEESKIFDFQFLINLERLIMGFYLSYNYFSNEYSNYFRLFCFLPKLKKLELTPNNSTFNASNLSPLKDSLEYFSFIGKNSHNSIDNFDNFNDGFYQLRTIIIRDANICLKGNNRIAWVIELGTEKSTNILKFENLNSLIHLELCISPNYMQIFDKSFYDLKNLKRLVIGTYKKFQNHLYCVPEIEFTKDIIKLQSLEFLDLGFQNISFDIFQSICELKYLMSLCIGSIVIRNEEILAKFRSRIKSFKSHHNNSENDPVGICLDLALRVECCYINNIYKLKYLEELRIRNSQLFMIPIEFNKLKNLKKLEISSHNNILFLSILGCDCSKLEELTLKQFGADFLVPLPQQVYKIKSLNTLELYNIKLQEIHDGDLVNLRKLILNVPSNGVIQKEIKNIQKLEILEIKGIKLRGDNLQKYVIPEELETMTKTLKYLNLNCHMPSNMPYSFKYSPLLDNDLVIKTIDRGYSSNITKVLIKASESQNSKEFYHLEIDRKNFKRCSGYNLGNTDNNSIKVDKRGLINLNKKNYISNLYLLKIWEPGIPLDINVAGQPFTKNEAEIHIRGWIREHILKILDKVMKTEPRRFLDTTFFTHDCHILKNKKYASYKLKVRKKWIFLDKSLKIPIYDKKNISALLYYVPEIIRNPKRNDAWIKYRKIMNLKTFLDITNLNEDGSGAKIVKRLSTSKSKSKCKCKNNPKIISSDKNKFKLVNHLIYGIYTKTNDPIDNPNEKIVRNDKINYEEHLKLIKITNKLRRKISETEIKKMVLNISKLDKDGNGIRMMKKTKSGKFHNKWYVDDEDVPKLLIVTDNKRSADLFVKYLK